MVEIHPLQIQVSSLGGREAVAALPIESSVSHFRVVCSEADPSKSTLSFIRNADVLK